MQLVFEAYMRYWFVRDGLSACFLYLYSSIVCICLAPMSFALTPSKIFLNREHVALLEVVKVDRKAMPPGDEKDPFIYFTVSVKVVAQIPPGQIAINHQIAIQHVDTDAMSRLSDTDAQDWFPVEVGKRVIVAFDSKAIPPGNELYFVYTSTGYTVDDTWKSCSIFYEAVDRPKADQAAELAKRLRKERQRLGPVFFRLVAGYDRYIIDDTQFSLAAAEYLSDTGVPLKARIEVARSLNPVLGFGDPASRALVASLVGMVQEAKKAGLHSGDVGNLITNLSVQFVSHKKRSALPEIEPATKQELLALARDPKIVPNQNVTVPLINWLDGKDPGEVPSPQISDGRPVPSGPPTKQEEISPKPPPAPITAPSVDQGGTSWKFVLKACCVVISASAVLALLIHFWRGRRAR